MLANHMLTNSGSRSKWRDEYGNGSVSATADEEMSFAAQQQQIHVRRRQSTKLQKLYLIMKVLMIATPGDICSLQTSLDT